MIHAWDPRHQQAGFHLTIHWISGAEDPQPNPFQVASGSMVNHCMLDGPATASRFTRLPCPQIIGSTRQPIKTHIEDLG